MLSRFWWPVGTSLGVILLILMTDILLSEAEEGFTLTVSCPPGFEHTADNRCLLRSLYQQYAAPKGFGGLRAPLPDVRDGFSPQEIDLGRYLFFDPVLSGDQAKSCASCHQPDKGFADGLGRSIGKDGKVLARGAPSLWNVAFLKRLFWDGRAASLEEQAAGPLLSPDEMAATPEGVEERLNGNAAYRRLFVEVYPETASAGISFVDVTRAIVAFEASLVSLNSRYDRYAHGDQSALDEKEIAGHNIFRSFVTRCSQCHTPPLFTSDELAVIGSPEPEGVNFDPGAEIPEGNPAMRGAFKVPGLRNIALTAPYMHSGRFGTLKEVIEFYNKGRGNAVPPGEQLNIHWHITDFNLSAEEVDALVAFLATLTDESMMPEIPVRVPSGLPVTEMRTHQSGERP
ncbi:cytochrome-c peroxidase [Emcibacter sp.]|uniref:cytochrome-c peroxidase n=1 Tax=Emcibacter sp. TaxID=1979954 RepID=UPI003A915110